MAINKSNILVNINFDGHQFIFICKLINSFSIIYSLVLLFSREFQ